MAASTGRLSMGGARARCPFVPAIDAQTDYADASSKSISAEAVSACAEGGLPTQALDMAEEKMNGFLKSGDKKREACMKLAAAELVGFMDNGSADFEEALERAGEAMSTFQDSSDKAMEATAQLVLSALNYKRQRTTECHQAASQAFLLFEELGNKGGQAKAYHALALSYLIPEDYDNATKSYKKAVALYKDLGLKQQQFIELQCMTESYMSQDKPQKAMKAAKDALAVASGLKGSKKGQALVLLQLAEAMVADGHGKRALKTVQDGLAKLREDGGVEGIIGGLQALLHTHLMLGSPGEAMEASKEAQTLISKIKDGSGRQYAEIDLMHSKSQALLGSGEAERAVKACRQAAKIAKELGDHSEEMEALNAIALAWASQDGTKNMAQDLVAEAKTVCQNSGNVLGEASVAMLSGNLLSQNKGSADEVLAEMEEARALYQEAEDIAGEAAALRVMVDCNVAKGDYAEAMEAASDSLELYKQLGKKKGQAGAMCAVANIHVQLGDNDEALESIEEGMALATEVGAKAVEARLQLLLAQVCVASMSQENLPSDKKAALPESYVEARTKALRATRSALELAGKCADKSVRASAYFWRAEALIWDGRGSEAVESAKEAEQSFARINDVRGQANSKVLQADIQIMMKQKEAAKASAEHALWLADGKRGMEGVQAAAHKVIEQATRVEHVHVPQDWGQQDQGQAQAQQQAASAEVWKKPALSVELVKGKVLEMAANVVADGEAVEQDVPFMEAGIDSLGSVQFVTDISKEFQLMLSPAAMFDYPTARSLIDHIIEESAEA